MTRPSTSVRDRRIVFDHQRGRTPKVLALLYGVTVWVIYKAIKRVNVWEVGNPVNERKSK